ncbi:MAG: cyclic nucleotide-binding domain-containing protein [Candidatus Omnitrophota bacterium]
MLQGLKKGDYVRLPSGSILMKEGEMGNCAYLLVEGRLQVEKEIDGENVPVGVIAPIDLVGEIAILCERPRSATVIALEDVGLIQINRHRLKQIIRRSPDIAETIIKILSSRVVTVSDNLAKTQARYDAFIKPMAQDAPPAIRFEEEPELEREPIDLEPELESIEIEPELEPEPIEEEPDKGKIRRMVSIERREKDSR